MVVMSQVLTHGQSNVGRPPQAHVSIACPECWQIRAWLKSLRDDRYFQAKF
jgi:hypothetical protein